MRHQEPDRGPKGELAVLPGFVQNTPRFLGIESSGDPWRDQGAVMEALGFDIFNAGWLEDPPEVVVEDDGRGNVLVRTALGALISRTANTRNVLEPPIKSTEDAYRFHFPPASAYSNAGLRRYVEHTDLFLIGPIGGTFLAVQNLFEFETFMMATIYDRRAIAHVIDKVVAANVEQARLLVEAGVHSLAVADDLAHSGGVFLSPKTLRDLFFPPMKEEVAELKKHGLPVFLHCDGDIREILDDVVAMGFDGLHSLQPSANMDIAEIKRRYGKDLFLMGNIDLNYVLTFGTLEEVEETVRRTIDVAAPGGGYILTTCNCLVDAVRPENAWAMYRTAEEHGQYPVRTKGRPRNGGPHVAEAIEPRARRQP